MVETLSSDLLNVLAQNYPLDLTHAPIRLTGGYECDVWRIGEIVIRICPAWRSEAEIRWIYDYVSRCAVSVSEVIAPIQTYSGKMFVVYNERIVLVFPFIEGEIMDTEQPALRWQAAQTLARIHRMPNNLSNDQQRPVSRATKPTDIPKQANPKYIQDDDLDAWYNEFVERDDLQMGMMHGDYYRGNILCRNGGIVGIIDWDECAYGAIIYEIAWAMWEICHTGFRFDAYKSLGFLYHYLQINPVPFYDLQAIIPLIRLRLRYEILRSVAMEEAGQQWDNLYRQSQILAFQQLKDITFLN